MSTSKTPTQGGFKRLGILLLSASLLHLSGCASLLKKWEKNHQFMVGAEDIPDPVIADALKEPDKKSAVAVVLGESERLCGDFMSGLVLAHNTATTALDLGTTAFTAAATAFTPLSTVHALTAAGSITSGSKIAVESDIYAKANVGNFSQAIQSTYYVHVRQYLDALSQMKDADINTAIEIAKLKSIHAECALASAQSTISATLSNATTPVSQDDVSSKKVTISVSGAIVKGTVVKLTAASSSTKPALAEALSYSVQTTDTPDTISSALIKLIAEDAKLKAAGISVVADSKSKSAFALSAPTSANVVWTGDALLPDGTPDTVVKLSISTISGESAAVVPGSGIGETTAIKKH